MSDKVSAVTAVAPVATPGRSAAFASPGVRASANAVSNSGTDKTAQDTLRLQDTVTLASTQMAQPASAGQGQSQTSSEQQSQAATLAAAEAAARARAAAQVREQSQHSQQEQQDRQAVESAASTLGSYFSDIHPDVNFRVEQQATGLVVLMVNSLDGKVLQTIPGSEARQLAESLFGSASLLPQTA